MTVTPYKAKIPERAIDITEIGKTIRKGSIVFNLDRDLEFNTEALQSYMFAAWEPVIYDAMVLAAAIEFADLARRIPWQLKLRDGQTKWILKKALAGVVPPEIIQRKKKGFGMPIGRWLREGKFEFDHARTFPHLDVTFAENKHAAHMLGKSDERLFLWSYWLLSQWMKK